MNAKRRVEYVAGMLDEIGLGRERIRMVNVSSAMAVQFAEEVKDMTGRLQALGPNPLQEAQSAEQ